MNRDCHEVTFNLIDVGTALDVGEDNPLLSTRRKSKEIRRPSITLSREISNASTGIFFSAK